MHPTDLSRIARSPHFRTPSSSSFYSLRFLGLDHDLHACNIPSNIVSGLPTHVQLGGIRIVFLMHLTSLSCTPELVDAKLLNDQRPFGPLRNGRGGGLESVRHRSRLGSNCVEFRRRNSFLPPHNRLHYPTTTFAVLPTSRLLCLTGSTLL